MVTGGSTNATIHMIEKNETSSVHTPYLTRSGEPPTLCVCIGLILSYATKPVSDDSGSSDYGHGRLDQRHHPHDRDGQ